ncbi:MAG: TetR/AcrR family transcriptional regulator [Anaerolineae bacterium]|jgi:AcrR family transcriptional regulator|nr:TetR/AcrR family transcriptional regulator [Anaerolineae bacterium]MDH7472673.1 TetR/AcrR family transcriptional regulator [Anaerolineae bacterium]
MSQQPRAEETRSRILTAAQESFARYGYDATGVAEICRLANVSKGAFYHHFPSKQAVFLELLNRWLAELDTQLETVRASAETVPEGLVRMAGMARLVFQAADGQLPIFLEFWTKAAHDPAVWQAMIAHYRRYQAFFADMIKAGIAEGTILPIEPETTAQVIVSLAVGLVLQGLLDPHGADWGQVAQEGIRMILDSIGSNDQ